MYDQYNALGKEITQIGGVLKNMKTRYIRTKVI
jgi:hypothetical protein